MPYYVHDSNREPGTGVPLDSKPLAIAYRTGTKTITFVASADERESWRDREARRMCDQTYRPLPWLDANGYPADYYAHLANASDHKTTPFYGNYDHKGSYWDKTEYHYAHLSIASDGMVAYTPDDAHGIEDRQKRIRCGRYLELTAPWLTPEEKDYLCALVRGMCGATFQIARTPEAIRAVYRYGQGFQSCMDARDFDQDDDTNPVSVYGDSDLGVAYLGSIDDKRITARCVIWPEKLVATRVYGDLLLGCLLKSAGYTAPWSKADDNTDVLTGATIRAIEGSNPGQWVMPYIDGTRSVTLHHRRGANYFECTRKRNDDDTIFDAKSTDGFVGSREVSCSHCGDTFNPGDDGSSVYCNDCENAQWTCDRCDDTSFDTDERYEHTNCYGNSVSLCEACDGRSRVQCDGCDEDYHPDSRSRALLSAASHVEIDSDGLCRDCLRADVAKAIEITPATADRYLTTTAERWSISRLQTYGDLGIVRVSSYPVTEAFDCPLHLESLSVRLVDVLKEYGDDLETAEYALPKIFHALVAADYARNHPEINDPQPIALPFSDRAQPIADPVRVALCYPYSDRMPDQILDQVVTVTRVGREYTVYGDSLTFNAEGDARHYDDLAPLSRFASGQQYRVVTHVQGACYELQEIR